MNTSTDTRNPRSSDESSAPLLEVNNLRVLFPIRTGILRRTTGHVHAVNGVSLTVDANETLGLVGESGCGKSTTARAIARLTPATSGSIRLAQTDITSLKQSQLKSARRTMQVVFQDPYSSLNPRLTVEQIITEPLKLHGLVDSHTSDLVYELMAKVGLDRRTAARYPREFSGGQRQRIGIARALILKPKLIILDEPVSALDVSIQAQIVNLLDDLQGELGLSYIFVAHDLSVVRHISDRVAVMYLGKIMEVGTTVEVYNSPRHPYSKALLSAVPIENPRLRGARERIALSEDLPSPAAPPSGCVFRTRCWKATSLCATEVPILTSDSATRQVACHYPES